MKVIGITGLIGTGKSTVSKFFIKRNIPYFDSDSYVFKLNSCSKILLKLNQYFPDAIIDNKLNKKKLKELLFKNYEKNIIILENIYHPHVFKKAQRFIFINRLMLKKIILLEVPLLFESNIDKLCDYTILVKCNKDTQIKRVKERSKISDDELEKIMKKQGNLSEKLKLVDFIVDTESSLDEVENSVNKIIEKVNKHG